MHIESPSTPNKEHPPLMKMIIIDDVEAHQSISKGGTVISEIGISVIPSCLTPVYVGGSAIDITSFVIKKLFIRVLIGPCLYD